MCRAWSDWVTKTGLQFTKWMNSNGFRRQGSHTYLFSRLCPHFCQTLGRSAYPSMNCHSNLPTYLIYYKICLVKNIHGICVPLLLKFTTCLPKDWSKRDVWLSLFMDIFRLEIHFLTAGNVDVHQQIIWNWHDVLIDVWGRRGWETAWAQ